MRAPSPHSRFDSSALAPRYRGVYLGRPVMRQAASLEAVYGGPPDSEGELSQALADLYPPRLAEAVTRWRHLADGARWLLLAAPAVFEDAESLEERLRHLPLHMQGQVYAMGCVLRGKAAPASWRRLASGLLFIPRRPYFEVEPLAKKSDGR